MSAGVRETTLYLADGRSVDVASFGGSMKVRDLGVMAFCCSFQMQFTGGGGMHYVQLRWHAGRRRCFNIEVGAAQLESAVELALGQLAREMRRVHGHTAVS